MAYSDYSQFGSPSAGDLFSGTGQSDKTVPLGIKNNDSERTVIFSSSSSKIDPAVGWLVCIKGVDRGRSFRLVKGNNTIGRPGNGNRYSIELSDQTISRKGSAGMIVYNEKGNTFFITPGDLTINVNTYLNDEILLSPQKLESRAVIEIAGDTLIFVPFCSDKFVWRFGEPEKARTEEKPRIVSEDSGKKGIVRCQKGHYYNADINASCPYCRELEKNDPDGVTKIL